MLLCMTVLSFLLATANWATTISTLVLFIRNALIRKALITGMLGFLHGAWPADFAQRIFILHQIAMWTVPFLMMINDGIVTWRAWVLCTGRRRLMIAPVLLLLGTYTMSFVFLALATHPRLTANRGGLTYATAIGALSMATNASSTLVIAYRLWICRKVWSIGLDVGWSYAQKVLLMIVESGALYFVLQLVTIYISNKNIKPYTPLAYISTALWAAYVQITAMYPTIVLLLIEQKRSLADMHCFIST